MIFITHAQDRLNERSYLIRNKEEMQDIVLQIKQGKTVCIKQDKVRNQSTHLVLMYNRPIVVVYDKNTKRLPTVIPFSINKHEKYLPELYEKNAQKELIKEVKISGFFILRVFIKNKKYSLYINENLICVKDSMLDIHNFTRDKLYDILDDMQNKIAQLSIV